MSADISHVAGFDDAPFARGHRGGVLVVGTVFSGLRLDGVLSAKVRRDGADSTRVLERLISRSRFAPQIHAVLLQGIAFAGFNVIDIHGLCQALRVPVVVVVRKMPDMGAVRAALMGAVRGGQRKWRLVEAAGPVEPAGRVFVQRSGIEHQRVRQLIERLAVHGDLPEPLRAAHIIAGGIGAGESRHRP